MLEISGLSKVYQVSGLQQKALDNVSVKFRENEFVSILGQSGSGKTTLLNMVGGLDNYTSGDLIINGRSTKEYNDRDWDTYRNHSIGFVFQSYNLIPHQTALSNVELALTLSGVSKEERRKRAKEALEKVGLVDHINKKPNQMSGGQMQRIAIARALVNNPDILLADEPTGALDSETSVQIMELLKEIAKDKLVIMVTHNADLAEEYSTRIVKLLDGKIIDDSNPFDGVEEKPVTDGKKKRTSMSFFTALALSLNNLMTKKTRTLLTAFAGSIGIIGIALILSLSSGVQDYINSVEEETLSSYPITIEQTSVDTSSLLSTLMENNNRKPKHGLDKIYSNNIMGDVIERVTSETQNNDLKAFKEYLESDNSKIEGFSNGIQYSYDLKPQIFKADTSDQVVQVNPNQVYDKLGIASQGMANMNMLGGSQDTWSELLDNRDLLESQNDVIAGKWPEKYDEVVLLVNSNNEISDFALYAMGLKDQAELESVVSRMMKGEKVTLAPSDSYSYEEMLDLRFKLIPNTDRYVKSNGIWVDMSENEDHMKQVVDKGVELKIVGIVRPKEDSMSMDDYGGIGYTSDLTKLLIEKVNASEIAKAQLADPKVNLFTGQPFSTDSKPFSMDDLTDEQKAQMAQLSQEEMAALIENYTKNANLTYEDNLKTLGIADLSNPTKINIYPKDFKAKESIATEISKYNETKTKDGHEEQAIHYSDFIGAMMSSVTSIVDTVSYVLIAFVAISLVVSSIMIAIITYISVLERTKEIGILRAIGASKGDISRVFNAETVIEGFTAGALGILITILLNIPINMVIKNLVDIDGIASLPVAGAVILILISVVLTVFAGIIPARIASKKDPVEALRTE